MANRLAREQSLYLRQHADNPVDWYRWGPEALERAREEERPILLSIGYSACHWCHVMERESFEDPDTAAVMNEAFVCVKVDREERPDVDAIYMRAVQALTGRGGWPLTVFLTPDARPYYGGTYFPPEPRHGMPSFRQVLSATRAAWDQQRGQVTDAAEKIASLLRRSTLGPEGEPTEPAPDRVDISLVSKAEEELLERFDPTFGGFGQAPKFPQPVLLDFLLSVSAFSGQKRALDAVVHTLRRMGRGGIRDHLAGGFHRYSVDRQWLVPHFEKMLYDNALLAGTYLRGFQLSGDLDLLAICRAVVEDLLENFRGPEGAFFAALDADSEGEEGRFYLWAPEEVDAALGAEESRLFQRCYDVSKAGNFEGRNILHLPHDLDAVARDEGVSPAELDRALAAAERAEGRSFTPGATGLGREAPGGVERPGHPIACRNGGRVGRASLRPRRDGCRRMASRGPVPRGTAPPSGAPPPSRRVGRSRGGRLTDSRLPGRRRGPRECSAQRARGDPRAPLAG